MTKGEVPEQDVMKPISKEVRGLASKLDDGSGKIIFSSCTDDELSLILAGDPLSLFTKVLIEGLEGSANHNGEEGSIKILEVLSYVFDQVPKRSKGKQNPLLDKIEDMSNNFSLCFLPQEIRKGLIASASAAPASDFQKKAFSMEMEGLQDNVEVVMDKISFLRKHGFP